MTAPTCQGFLGYQPLVEPLILNTGTTFVQTIQPSGGAQFPAGTTVQIVLTGPGGTALGTWPATVTTTSASWVVPNGTADAIPANSRYALMVTYPTSPATTYAWFQGAVIRP
jgi:hypothetical protein